MVHPLASASARVQQSGISVPKYQLGENPSVVSSCQSPTSNVHSLAALWARKYFISVTATEDQPPNENSENLKGFASKEGRERTAEKLIQNLTLASAQAWSLTEQLLSEEVRRHGINPELINPLEIAADTRELFQKVLKAYAESTTPPKLSVIVGKDFGRVRQKYTSVDRRAIGFVSMQFHYTGQMLLQWLALGEQMLWMPYLKVMDDHMYMPLQAAYDAAAKHSYESPAISAVQQLLPVSSKIAVSVCRQISRQHPNYRSYSGPLSEITVRTASIRDVEMFQIYLCLCVLEEDIHAVQQELFPLCVMLYPRLQVSWRLVQDMLKRLGWDMHDQLTPENMSIFLPYLRTLTEMFSPDVFQ